MKKSRTDFFSILPGAEDCDAGQFVRWIEESDIGNLATNHQSLPAERAIGEDTTKLLALELMSETVIQFLPVGNQETREFVGVVEQSALISAMVAENTRRVSE